MNIEIKFIKLRKLGEQREISIYQRVSNKYCGSQITHENIYKNFISKPINAYSKVNNKKMQSNTIEKPITYFLLKT